MKIDETVVHVSWEDNSSVRALFEYVKDGRQLTLHRYGGFEQVGNIGKNLTSNDKRITTTAGDIMLYASNQLVIFYGSNTWDYTKLGHINLTQTELNHLLNKNSVTIFLESPNIH